MLSKDAKGAYHPVEPGNDVMYTVRLHQRVNLQGF